MQDCDVSVVGAIFFCVEGAQNGAFDCCEAVGLDERVVDVRESRGTNFDVFQRTLRGENVMSCCQQKFRGHKKSSPKVPRSPPSATPRPRRSGDLHDDQRGTLRRKRQLFSLLVECCLDSITQVSGVPKTKAGIQSSGGVETNSESQSSGSPEQWECCEPKRFWGVLPSGEFARCPLDETLIVENGRIPHHLAVLNQNPFMIEHRQRLVVRDIKAREILFCEPGPPGDDAFPPKPAATEQRLEEAGEHKLLLHGVLLSLQSVSDDKRDFRRALP